MFVYETQSPIDWWIGWHKPEDIFRVGVILATSAADTYWEASDWYAAWTLAQRGARQLGWEGDCRQGPFVCPCPEGDDAGWRFIIGWKQDNNGTSYIASPVELPHLRCREYWIELRAA